MPPVDAEYTVGIVVDSEQLLKLVRRLLAADNAQDVLHMLLDSLGELRPGGCAVLLFSSEAKTPGYAMHRSPSGAIEESTFAVDEFAHLQLSPKSPQPLSEDAVLPFKREGSGSLIGLGLRWGGYRGTLLHYGDTSHDAAAHRELFLVAEAAQIALKQLFELQALRDSTQKESFARFEAERSISKQRESTRELLRTKNFLESMIAASVDGIVAADLQGNIILYNQGAERIHKRHGEDVVGQLHVTALYPEGVAHDIMRMIRSEEHGGLGRLESTRLEALDSEGNRIPISLSAAMIYDEEGNEKASFGIFTDLREWVQVEKRLHDAREKLKLSERQAMIAELAGAAAHELNQPLTTIVAYSDMLAKRIKGDALEERAIKAIVRDAERMADIVKRIGRITKYETTTYVGSQKIFDLDRASEDQ